MFTNHVPSLGVTFIVHKESSICYCKSVLKRFIFENLGLEIDFSHIMQSINSETLRPYPMHKRDEKANN